MPYTGPYIYTLHLTGPEEKRRILKKEFEGIETNFQAPVTARNCPKIYILQIPPHHPETENRGRILYVGYTGQSVSLRLGYGFRADGSNGYHGYKWRNLDKLTISVFVFDPFTGDEAKDNAHKLFVEAIEAEIVYLIRNKTGRWPEFQNEIHFNNINLERTNKISKEIYSTLSEF